MEIKTKSSRMHSLIALFDMHTEFLPKAIAGISDKDSHNRMDSKANHIAWLTGSLVEQRFELANMLAGSNHKQSADELFKDHKGIQDNATYPNLSEFIKDWKKITPALREALSNASDEKLDSELEMEGIKMTNYELITFMTYREANCIGQIALWRRLMNYDPIKYD